MSDWNPNQYLKFERERTRPSHDLVGKIQVPSPNRILDVGCGPGTSTKVLKDRWPSAEVEGLDNSKAMIEKASSQYPEIKWVLKDSSEDLSFLGKYDIIFSNAAFQWIPDHPSLIKKLFGMLNEGGALAVQVPWLRQSPVYVEIQKMIKTEKWAAYFQSPPEYPKHFPFPHYYNILCGLTQEISAWQTDYFHIVKSHEDIVEWYRGSGLRAFLDMLPTEELKSAFCEEYTDHIAASYPIEKDNNILLPFTRIFFIAVKT